MCHGGELLERRIRDVVIEFDTVSSHNKLNRRYQVKRKESKDCPKEQRATS